jgi:hypothetical protein
LYFFAYSVDLCKLRYVCLQELDLTVRVQVRALFDYSLRGRLISADDIDAWGDSVLDEGLCSIFSNS